MSFEWHLKQLIIVLKRLQCRRLPGFVLKGKVGDGHHLRRKQMLVLSRRKHESIVINNDITITVVEIMGDKVRLGIVAPKEVPVHRQEVYEAIHGKPADTAAPKT